MSWNSGYELELWLIGPTTARQNNWKGLYFAAYESSLLTCEVNYASRQQQRMGPTFQWLGDHAREVTAFQGRSR